MRSLCIQTKQNTWKYEKHHLVELRLAQKSSSAKRRFIFELEHCYFIYTVTGPFKYIRKEWTVFLRALIGLPTSGYPVLITVSPPVPPSERRQTRVSYEQNGFPRFAFLTNQRNLTQKSNKLKYTKKVTKFGLEVLTGKALSVWLEFIDETDVKGFCLQGSKISLKLDLKNSQLFLKKFPRKS